MLFPLFLDLSGRSVLVVGGGSVAERKVALLLQSSANVTVMAPRLTPQLEDLHLARRIHYKPEFFQDNALDGMRLVIAAVNDRSVNMDVASAAARRGMFCNVVDQPALSDCQVPSILDRSPLMVAISSGGTAPVLARRIREQLEAVVDEAMGRLADLLAQFRGRIVDAYSDLAARRDFYDAILDGPVLELLRSDRDHDARQFLIRAIEEPDAYGHAGSCHVVGAGAGAPGHLTLEGLRSLNQADVVVSDRSIHPGILAKSRRDAVQVDISKSIAHSATAEGRVNVYFEVILPYANHRKRVVVLRAGDGKRDATAIGLAQALSQMGVESRIIRGVSD